MLRVSKDFLFKFILLTFLMMSPFKISMAHTSVPTTVRPTRAEAILDSVLFQLKQEMRDLYKKGRQVEMTANAVSLFSASICGQQIIDNQIRLETSRREDKVGQQIRITESLSLRGCKDRKELFFLERTGTDIETTTNDDLFRGILPDLKKTTHYLFRMNSNALSFESKTIGDSRTSFLLLNPSSSDSIHVNFEEIFYDKTLIRQSMRVLTYVNSRQKENYDLVYVWNINPNPETPRQFLYLDGNELGPSVYLEIHGILHQAIGIYISLPFASLNQFPDSKNQ